MRFQDLEAELHQRAMADTGLQDFGGDEYRTGMRVLLRALDREPKLTNGGRQFAYGMVLGTLTARLHAQRGWSQRPEVLNCAITRPLIITGVPRTGTTALHKLLSLDPQFQGLEHWLAETPMPRPARDTWSTLPAFKASVASLDAYFTLIPEMRKAHDMVADEVDECLEILRQDFISNRFGSSVYVPSYDEWWSGQSEKASYQRYANVLRLIGANHPDKIWLLKNPGHIAEIETLFEVFPDACIIHTHRDPIDAIPSLCSTLHMSRRMFEGKAADPKVIGEREARYWHAALEAGARARVGRTRQFFDVDHREFSTDPLGVLGKIYTGFDLTLSAATRDRMRQWCVAPATSRHGEHRYRLEDFGISRDRVESLFGGYRTQHGFN